MIDTNVIATVMANRGEVIKLKSNSILTNLTMYGCKEEDFNLLSNNISSAVMNELILIKNKLLPFKDDFANAVKEKTNEAVPSVFDNFFIKEIRIPEYVYALKSDNVIKGMRAPLILPITSLSINLPELPIKTLLKDEDSYKDAMLQRVANKYSEADLINLWSKFFFNVSKSNSFISNLTMDMITDVNDIVIVYAIANRLVNDKPISVSLPDNVYTDIMNDFIFELLNAMAAHIFNYENYEKIGKLIYSTQRQNYVTVHGNLYDRFLDEGGCSDVILGLYISVDDIKDETTVIDNILAKKDIYTKAYENKIKFETVQANLAVTSKYKIVYSIVLREVFEHIPADLKDVLGVTFVDADRLLNLLLNVSDYSFILNVDEMVMAIVGKIMFPDTNFKRFSDYMLEYSRLNPNVTPQEAASFASLDMIVDYLLQQVQVQGPTHG